MNIEKLFLKREILINCVKRKIKVDYMNKNDDSKLIVKRINHIQIHSLINYFKVVLNIQNHSNIGEIRFFSIIYFQTPLEL